MSGVFTIPLLNGIRFTPEEIDIDARYNTLPFDSLIDEQNYAQPWLTNDNPPIHLLSDFISLNCDFYNCKGIHQANFPFVKVANSLQQQTFLPYKAICDFSGFTVGRYYGRITYDGNLPAQISASLTEYISPFVDGNLQIKDNGTQVDNLTSSGTSAVSMIAGHTYLFNAYGAATSTAANPRIRLTVTKTINGVTAIIFDQSAVQTNTVSITYSGIAQPGAVYTAKVITEDTAAVVTPINIPDTGAVATNVKAWRSCPIDIQVSHPETMLYQYTNSYNKNDIIFTPNSEVLQLRVEANIRNYQPSANRQTFDDQEYDATLLNGIAFRTHTNYILGTGGPDWVVDKLNLIFTLSSVKIDTTYYVAINGKEFKGVRPSEQKMQDGMWSLELQEVPGDPGASYQPGADPTGDLIVIRKVWPLAPFPNFSAPFFITGIFTQYSNLDSLVVYNYGLNTFNLLIGTTIGASDIASLEIGTPNADASIDLISNHDIGHGFNVPTTVFVTTPPGVDLKTLFIYDQLDSPALNSPTPTAGGMVQGQVSMYKELVNGYFTRDWDISTGFGKAGSLYEGCQILDEYAGKIAIGWDRTTVDPAEARGMEVGNPGNEVQITRAELPAEGLNMFTSQVNSTPSDTPGPNDPVARARSTSGSHVLDYEIVKGTIEPTIGRTALLGAGSSMYIGNDALITLFFVKL